MGLFDRIFKQPSSPARSPARDETSDLEPNEKKYHVEIGDLLRGNRPINDKEADEKVSIRRAAEYIKASQHSQETHRDHLRSEESENSRAMVLVAEFARDIVYSLRSDKRYSAVLEDRERVRQAQIKAVAAIIYGQSKDQKGSEEGRYYGQDEFKLALRIKDARLSRDARNDAREELTRIMEKMILEELNHQK